MSYWNVKTKIFIFQFSLSQENSILLVLSCIILKSWIIFDIMCFKGEKKGEGVFKSPCNADHFNDSQQIKLGCFGSMAGYNHKKTNFTKSTLLRDTPQCIAKVRTLFYTGEAIILYWRTQQGKFQQGGAVTLLLV